MTPDGLYSGMTYDLKENKIARIGKLKKAIIQAASCRDNIHRTERHRQNF
jgi:hypothetical protein